MEEQQNPQQYPNQTPPPQNNYGNPQQQYQQPQNGYGYPQQQYQQPQNNYGYPQQQYQQPQNNYGYPQQQYQQPQNNYAYPQQQYQQPQNNYGYSQQQYQQPYQPYAPQMQNGCAYQPPQKKEPGRVANFFLSLLPLVGFFAVQILVSVVVVVIMVFVNAFQSGRTQNVMAAYEEIVSASIPVATALAHLVSAVGFAFWYRLSFQKPRPAPRETVQKLRPEPILMGLGLGILMAVFSSGTAGLETLLFPRMVEDTYAMLEQSGIGTNYMVIFATVILAPIGEELIFRGLTMKYAEKAFGRFWAANLLQAFLFGVAHMNWVQGVYAFFGGLVLGWVAHHYKSVVFSMIMHFVCDIADCDSGSIGSRIDFMAHRCGEKTAGAQSERFRISVFGVCAHTVRDKNRFLLVQEPVFWWGKANPIDFFTRSCYNKVIIFCKRGMWKCQ